MSSWKLVVITLAVLGTTTAAAVGLAVGGGRPDGPAAGRGAAPGAVAQPPPAKQAEPPAIKPLPEPVEVMLPKQMERRLNAAAQRLGAQRAYYEEGRIAIDRFIQALELYYEARKERAKTREERILAAQSHMERLDEVLNREQAELMAGRGTVADVAEAQLARELAAVELIKAHRIPGAGDVEALQRRLEAVEKRLEEVVKRVERPGIDRR